MRSSIFVVVAVATGVGGCVEEGPEGTTGAKGKVVFQAPSALIFTSPVAVGSTFHLTFAEKNDDVGLSDDAVLVVDKGDATVVANEDDGGFDVTLDGSGTVVLAVDDNGVVDTINVDARDVAESAVVDAVVLAAIDVVDARVPKAFAVLGDQETHLLVSAVDACAAGVLDFGASALVVVAKEEGVDPATVATVEGDGAAGFVVTPQVETGSFTLELHTGQLAVLSYDVDIVSRDDVDEVHAEVAAVDSQAGTARMWGRAFVNDVDVLGLDFDWSSDPRVTLDLVKGPAVTATISFPTDGTEDDRPAVVTAEVFGNDDDVDLLGLQQGSLIAARDKAPERPAAEEEDADDEAASGDGCTGGGAGTCAAGVVFVGLLRRKKKK